MRITRLFVPLAVVASGMVIGIAPAVAQPYPADSPVVEVSSGTVVDGNSIVFSGQHFGANDTITIDVTFFGQTTGAGQGHTTMAPIAFILPREIVKTIHADSEGSFSTTLTLNGQGRAVITATGSPSGVTAAATVIVLPAGPVLPVTGDSGTNLTMIVLGVGIASLGAILLGLARVRRRKVLHTRS